MFGEKILRNKGPWPIQIWEHDGFFVEAILESVELQDLLGALTIESMTYNTEQLSACASIQTTTGKNIILTSKHVRAYCFSDCSYLYNADSHLLETPLDQGWKGFC